MNRMILAMSKFDAELTESTHYISFHYPHTSNDEYPHISEYPHIGKEGRCILGSLQVLGKQCFFWHTYYRASVTTVLPSIQVCLYFLEAQINYTLNTTKSV